MTSLGLMQLMDTFQLEQFREVIMERMIPSTLEEPDMRTLMLLEKYSSSKLNKGFIYEFKVNPEHGCCYIPFGGEEHAKEKYQVLVIDKMRLKH